jgi:hypothetical protein
MKLQRSLLIASWIYCFCHYEKMVDHLLRNFEQLKCKIPGDAPGSRYQGQILSMTQPLLCWREQNAGHHVTWQCKRKESSI